MEETTNGGLKFCENCGARLQPGAKFCDNCGQKIVYAGEPVFPPVPAEEAQKQEQAQGFPEEEQAQQGSAYQQNDYQQNNYQQSAQQGAGRPSSNAVLPAK
ncbi:MAG: zinc ribbon domain-containing protein, partial [Stomatobaculum sp.]|nr:zinc ribbon domain-containing protein [Stomatobaculum sp.]